MIRTPQSPTLPPRGQRSRSCSTPRRARSRWAPSITHHWAYTAVASDEHDMLVALVRKRGETLHQLLDRLEQALGPAIEEQIYVDEINNP